MRPCLIIGCGYLGRRVAALWRAEGQRVLATTRRSETAEEWRRLGLEPVVCDVLAPEALASLPPLETVLYAVGFDRSSGASMRSVYVDGLARVLDHLPAFDKFVHVSSSSVYGQTEGEWVDEDSPTDPQEESGRIVLDAEKFLRVRRPEAVILRFAGIYGPGRLLRQKSIEAGEPIVGNAERWLNLIHVEDGARAVLAARNHAPPGTTFNVADGYPVLRRDFYAELARLLQAPAPRFVPVPPGQPTPPHERGHRRIDSRRLREVLGFRPAFATFRLGLAASIG